MLRGDQANEKFRGAGQQITAGYEGAKVMQPKLALADASTTAPSQALESQRGNVDDADDDDDEDDEAAGDFMAGLLGECVDTTVYLGRAAKGSAPKPSPTKAANPVPNAKPKAQPPRISTSTPMAKWPSLNPPSSSRAPPLSPQSSGSKQATGPPLGTKGLRA